MKEERPSSTSLLIARGVLLAEVRADLQPLLIAGSAAAVHQFPGVATSWFKFVLKHRSLQNAVLGLEHLVLPGILLHWLMRKSLLNEFAHAAVAAGCRQLVVLGAGLDTLAWRMQASIRCFEMDHPATQRIKHKAPGGHPSLLPIDLLHRSVRDVLRKEAQYQIHEPTLFVAEGLLMYLPPARVAALFREIAESSASGSRFAFTLMETRPDRRIGFHNCRRLVDWWLNWRGEVFHWSLFRKEVAAFCAENGWSLESLSSPVEFRSRFLEPYGLGRKPLASGETVALAYRRG